jgi:hypothetical protein
MIPLVTAGVSGTLWALVDPTRFASVSQHLASLYIDEDTLNEKPTIDPSGGTLP